MLRVHLDPEQEDILRSVQHNKKTTVASGTARGKDFVTAVACMCFLYLTPKWNEKGEMIENTKVAMTAPTDRQVGNIMFPEIARLYAQARFLPGRLTGYDIRFENKEWFLTGFKADNNKPEVWTGFHAVHTMFAVTEASGMADMIYNSIEGNLQNNSRLLIVFNPNVFTGYAAASMKKPGWSKFRLDSLTAPNVKERKVIIPAQVDHDWVESRLHDWCNVIAEKDFKESEGDFCYQEHRHDGIDYPKALYRPNDLFRVKVRGMFPKVAQDVLIPLDWIEKAQVRWKDQMNRNREVPKITRIGMDVAGMGRDSTASCFRKGWFVEKFKMHNSAGEAKHMEVSGIALNDCKENTDLMNGKYCAIFIDTIGEGAGVFSRMNEIKETNEPKDFNNYSWLFPHSAKFSESANTLAGAPLKDITNQYFFLNMRAYCYWALRDWLNSDNNTGAALPPDDHLTEELTETKWEFMSNGGIKIEPKEDIKKRLGRSPDKADALALTFWPVPDPDLTPKKKKQFRNVFH